jgi:Domain of unknown function (DUF4131)
MTAIRFPRQPFVGLALMAALGIVIADFVPVPEFQWLFWGVGFVLIALVLFWEPNTALTYLVVGCGFFLIHNFRTRDTPGLWLANDLTERPRVVTATGFVTSESKIAPNGFATFLFKLESIEFEGETRSTSASLFVRWRGNPEFGDELKLFGIAEPISPPRNPGEFDMRAYLARQGCAEKFVCSLRRGWCAPEKECRQSDSARRAEIARLDAERYLSRTR